MCGCESMGVGRLETVPGSWCSARDVVPAATPQRENDGPGVTGARFVGRSSGSGTRSARGSRICKTVARRWESERDGCMQACTLSVPWWIN